jgi:uncharacterized membrane protein YqjE
VSTTQESTGLTMGQLVGLLSEQTSKLVRAEIELAKAELTAKAQRLAVGIGLFVVAALLAFFALGTLIAAAVLGLSEAVAPWLAALLVVVVLLIITGILVLVGKRSVTAAMPAQPERAVANVRDDVQAVKEGFRS